MNCLLPGVGIATWAEANTNCQAQGGSLVDLSNPVITSAMSKAVQAKWEKTWIGGQGSVGDWHWQKGYYINKYCTSLLYCATETGCFISY